MNSERQNNRPRGASESKHRRGVVAPEPIFGKRYLDQRAANQAKQDAYYGRA